MSLPSYAPNQGIQATASSVRSCVAPASSRACCPAFGCAEVSTLARPIRVERVRPLQPPQPILVVDLFPEILDALLRLLGGLSADAWQRPTVCPVWCVQDVALPLLAVEVGNLSRRRHGHAVAASITSWEE